MAIVSVFSKTGKELINDINSELVKVTENGSIVKIKMPTSNISGAAKSGNNLVILQKDGNKITLEDFFPAGENVKPTKLVIEDGKFLYEAKYDADHFNGLEFSSVNSIDDVIDGKETSNEINPAVWIVPLLALSAAGIAIATHNNGGDGKSSSKPVDPVEPVEPDKKTQVEFDKEVAKIKPELVLTKLDALKAAIEVLKAAPTAENIASVKAAKDALTEELFILQGKVTAFDELVKSADLNKLNTTEAKLLLDKIASEMGDAVSTSENANEIISIVSDLLEQVVGLDSAFTAMKDVLVLSETAKTQPSEANIQAAQEALSVLQANLAEIKASVEVSLNAAAEKGISTAVLKEQADVAFGKVESEINTIIESMQAAEANLAAVNDAYAKLTDYNTKVLSAENKVKEANLAIEAAKKAKDEAIKANNLDKVDEINAQIKAANEGLVTAKQSLNELIEIRDEAVKSIENISKDVADNHKPNVNELKDISVKPSEPIDKGIVVKESKGIFEAIKDGLTSFKDMANNEFKEFINKVLASKPVEVVKDVIQGIKNAVKNIADTVWSQIKAPVQVVKEVIKGIKDYFAEVGGFVKGGIKIGADSVKEVISGAIKVFKDGVNSIVENVKKTIHDSIKDMKLTDWINPVKVGGLIKDIIVGGIKSGVKAVWDTIKSVPGKGLDFIVQKIKDMGSLVGDSVVNKFHIVKDSVQEIIKILGDAFIKIPFDNLVKPILEALNPLNAIPKIGSVIWGTIKDVVGIIKSLKDIPEKSIDIVKNIVKDIMDSFKGDKVTEGNGEEVKVFLKEITDTLEAHSNEVAKVNENKSTDEIKTVDEVKESSVYGLNELLSDNNTEINLDALAPKEGIPSFATSSEALAETQIFVNQPMIEDQTNPVSMVA